MKKSFFTCLSIFLIVALALAGCTTQKKETAAPEKEAELIEITDDAGNVIMLKQPAKKVVSLAPANTEIVFALGKGDNLVGVTTYCDYPAAAKVKEKIGDFANPNIEKILSLSPGVVLATGGIQEEVTKKIKESGIAVVVVDPKSFSELYADIEKVGKLIGAEENAREVINEMKKTVKNVETAVANREKPGVFFEIYSQPLMTAGKETFINEMVELAGGVNLGAQAGSGYPQYSLEQLVKDDPQVYIAVKGSMSDPGEIKKRSGFGQLKAVKEDKVYVVDDNLVSRPGPRLVQGLLEIAKAIHPEAFSK